MFQRLAVPESMSDRLRDYAEDHYPIRFLLPPSTNMQRIVTEVETGWVWFSHDSSDQIVIRAKTEAIAIKIKLLA